MDERKGLPDDVKKEVAGEIQEQQDDVEKSISESIPEIYKKLQEDELGAVITTEGEDGEPQETSRIFFDPSNINTAVRMTNSEIQVFKHYQGLFFHDVNRILNDPEDYVEESNKEPNEAQMKILDGSAPGGPDGSYGYRLTPYAINIAKSLVPKYDKSQATATLDKEDRNKLLPEMMRGFDLAGEIHVDEDGAAENSISENVEKIPEGKVAQLAVEIIAKHRELQKEAQENMEQEHADALEENEQRDQAEAQAQEDEAEKARKKAEQEQIAKTLKSLEDML